MINNRLEKEIRDVDLEENLSASTYKGSGIQRKDAIVKREKKRKGFNK